MTRTPEAYQQALDSVNVEHEPDLQPGYGGAGWTHCNLAVHRATTALGCPIPLLLANQQLSWLALSAPMGWGWREVVLNGADLQSAQGSPVVVAWAHEPHGHIAMVRRVVAGVSYVMAAGARNFNNVPLTWSFGPAQPLRFFTHE